LFPEVPLTALDTVWFQIAGTVCNLQCTHCFISCSPQNHTHEMMTLEQVERALAESEKLGVREYYFTGGEPFMHRDIVEMIAAALRRGPCSILTNGTLLRAELCKKLRALEQSSDYSLDIRISLDGWDAATNDPIRGEGTFSKILLGIANLAAAGLNPVLTVTEACSGAGSQAGRSKFLEFLRELGLNQPRLKTLPLLRLGAEEKRDRPYLAWETLRDRTLTAKELEALQCSSSRMVTASGVWVCPILLDSPEARMGDVLADSLRAYPLRHAACHTCHTEGLSCRT
jgi:MoaA/NifB/PqqE/SkfB family radical SAM enzyme